MNRRKLITLLTILLTCVMVIHVAVAMYIHAQHHEWSAPFWVNIIKVIYYPPGYLALAITNMVWKKKEAQKLN